MDLAEQDSLERRAFRHFLRTGQRVYLTTRDLDNSEAMYTKFNPYHDPRNGRFTFGPGGIAASRSSAPSPARRSHSEKPHVIRGPLKTSVGKADLHEQAARTINHLATTPNSTGQIRMGGITYSVRRFGDKRLELTAKGGKITGELLPDTGKQEVILKNITVSAPLLQAHSKPTTIRFFRGRDRRLFYVFDKPLKIGPFIGPTLIHIAAGTHAVDQ